MKRLTALLGALILGSALTGCTSDTRGDAVNGVITLMNQAVQDIGGITKEVDKAVEKNKKENATLDFADAIKNTKALEKTGKEVQKVKVEQVDRVKPADDDEKADFKTRFGSRINQAVSELVKAKAGLNDALKKAEDLGGDAKEKVDELRSKIREAEGPFESLARQLG